MPIITAQRNRQRNLIAVFSLVVVAIISILYFGRSKDTVRTTPAEERSETAREAREIRLNEKLLTAPRFKKLIPYARLPKTIITGRNNPFAPYSTSEPAYIREQIERRKQEATREGVLPEDTSREERAPVSRESTGTIIEDL